MLAVGSVTVDDRHASYSNVQSYVRIVAPGGDPTGGERDPDPTHWIPSLYPRALGGYAQLAGTSQAAPHVAAVAALVLSRRPSLTSEEVVALLTSTARPLGGTVPNPTFGYGQLDAAAAVRAALACGGAPGPPGAAPSMAASIRIYLPMTLRNACAT